MGLKLRLAPVLAVCVFVLCVFGGVALHTLNEVKINGSHYLEIVRYKDLIADILPPPSYIIESYLVAFQMADEKDPAKRTALIARMKVLSKEYSERHEFWTQDLDASPMKDEMIVKSYKPAKAFYEIVAKDFIPAVERQDREAIYSHLDKLGALYEEHRQSIDRVVKAFHCLVLLLEIGMVGELDRPDLAPLDRAADGGEAHDVRIALGEGGEFVAQLLPGVISAHVAAQGGGGPGERGRRREGFEPEAFGRQGGLFGGREDGVGVDSAAARGEVWPHGLQPPDLLRMFEMDAHEAAVAGLEDGADQQEDEE